MTNSEIESQLNNIKAYLNSALMLSNELQIKIQEDADKTALFKKLSNYLTPNINYWVNNESQAGSIRDIEKSLKDKNKK